MPGQTAHPSLHELQDVFLLEPPALVYDASALAALLADECFLGRRERADQDVSLANPPWGHFDRTCAGGMGTLSHRWAGVREIACSAEWRVHLVF